MAAISYSVCSRPTDSRKGSTEGPCLTDSGEGRHAPSFAKNGTMKKMEGHPCQEEWKANPRLEGKSIHAKEWKANPRLEGKSIHAKEWKASPRLEGKSIHAKNNGRRTHALNGRVPMLKILEGESIP